MAGQGGGLGADALHQVAVADEGVRVVVDDRVPGRLKVAARKRLGDGHAHSVGEALAQRTGGDLDPGRAVVSGWPGVRLPHCRKALRSSRVRP